MKFKLIKPGVTSARASMGHSWRMIPQRLFVYLHDSERRGYVEAACRRDGITGLRVSGGV